MDKLPLISGVKKYREEENISFCMPGHKNGRGFLCTEEGRDFYDNIVKVDITEVEGVDNLHNPEGIIKESQELLKEAYESEKSYFLVNGSTCGNLAMIFSCFEEGEKIIVERNCHRSIYNGIIMRKLNPVYINNSILDEYEIPFCVDEENFKKTLENNKDAKGVVITYPNYYGICMDLEKVIEIADKYNMKVLVDSAHGAHFGFAQGIPHSAVQLGADMVVTSAHKTLPSLTQTAFLHINNSIDIDKVDFYVSAFMSTSPSYMLMQSMDYSRMYLQKYAENTYKKLLELCRKYREKINSIKGFHILGREDINNINFYEIRNKYNRENYIYDEVYKNLWKYDIDETRYAINLDADYSGHKLAEYLRKNKIQVEMSDRRNIILIFSPFNIEEEFEVLYDVLNKCDLQELREKHNKISTLDIPKAKILPYEAFAKEKTIASIYDSEGSICGEAIVPYPPGVPIVMPGEVITRDCIEYIDYCIKNNMSVLGMQDDRCKIIID